MEDLRNRGKIIKRSAEGISSCADVLSQESEDGYNKNVRYVFLKVQYGYSSVAYRLQGLFGSVGIQYKWFRFLSEYETGSFNFG